MSSKIFIISGPSGVGEDSIIKGLSQAIEIEKPITSTTRQMRPGEENGKQYYFISKEEFKNGIENDAFFEWAEEDNNNFYGVTRKEIERAIATGKTVIWKVDYKGTITIKKLIPDAVAILISAPLEVIEQRLRNRDKNVSEQFIQARMEYAKGWLENKATFDFEVENEEGKLEETIQKVIAIINNNQ